MKNCFRSNKGLLLFLCLFGVFRTAVADWNPIPSGSMRPNLLEGDVVFVNRLAFNLKVPLTDIVVAQLGQPQRGDVVTFSSPLNGTRLIKRIIGLPGDTVEMRDERLILNGRVAQYDGPKTVRELVGVADQVDAVRLDETMGTQQHRIQLFPKVSARRDFGPLRVPPDQFLMLGDNRDNSADSRYFGFVPRALLIGKAERILVSADIVGNWLPRIERFGQRIE